MRQQHIVLAGMVLAALKPGAAAADSCSAPGWSAPSDRVNWTANYNMGEPLIWPAAGMLPALVDEGVESTSEFAAGWGAFRAKYSHLQTMAGTGDSFGLAVKDRCPGLAGVRCTAGVLFKEDFGNTTLRYDVGVSGSFSFFRLFDPNLSVAAIHNDSQDGSDTLLTSDIGIPFGCVFDDPRLTFHVRGGGSYSFQQKQVKPTWGASFDFKPFGPNDGLTLTVGYGGAASLNDAQELDVKHRASISIEMRI